MTVQNAIQLVEGFYAKENDGIRDFHWMSTAGILKLPSSTGFVTLFLANPQSKTVLLHAGEGKKEYQLVPGWQNLFLDLNEIALDGKALKLCCAEQLHVVGDSRELALMVGYAVHAEEQKKIAVLEKGFYSEESDGIARFCWMSKQAQIRYFHADENDWLIMYIKSPSEWAEKIDFARDDGEPIASAHVLPGEWKAIGISLKNCPKEGKIFIRTEYSLQAEGDTRQLSFMIASPKVGIPTVYERNSALMHQEVFHTIKPQSHGTLLACDTSAECNLRCLMCVLDKELRQQFAEPAKGLEKTRELTLALLETTSKAQPYLTGEPFFRNDVWDVVDRTTAISAERIIETEVSTNGLLIKDACLERLLESNITSLLVTVNAGTAKTYRRICGGNFELLLSNLKELCQHPRRKQSLTISLSFVIMRENVEELSRFIEVAHEVGADLVQLWSMNSMAIGMPDRTRSDGFHFNYRQQMPKYYPHLTARELEKAHAKAKALGVRIGETPAYRTDLPDTLEDIPYPLSVEEFEQRAEVFDKFYVTLQKQKNNISHCYYPWNSVYYTTEGSFAPCLHLIYKGGVGNVLNNNFAEVWNSEQMQKLRQDIINGVIPEICKNTQCPFV